MRAIVLDRCSFPSVADGKMGIEVSTHNLDQERVKEALESFVGADCARALKRIVDEGGFFPRCSLGRMDLLLVGQYMETWSSTPYWEIILRGGMPGFSLCLHEMAEIEWYFHHHNDNGELDPYDRTLKTRSSGHSSSDQEEGYDEAHAWALLVEHRYIQLRAREESEDFSLRELVLANPHGWDGTAGVANDHDWDLLLEKYETHLMPADQRLDPVDNLRSVRAWYERRGYRRPH